MGFVSDMFLPLDLGDGKRQARWKDADRVLWFTGVGTALRIGGEGGGGVVC